MTDITQFEKKENLRNGRLAVIAVFEEKTFFTDQQNIADENLI